MSRDTIFTTDPPKHFRGEDRPQKSKHATHLITYSNFLTGDQDHSQDRPFTYAKPTRKAPLPDPPLPNPKTQQKPTTGRTNNSSYNLLSFDAQSTHQDLNPVLRRCPQKQASSLNPCGEPQLNDRQKPTKKVNSGVYTSEGVRRAFTYE